MLLVGLITFFVFSSSIHASVEDSTSKENVDSFEKISNEEVEEGNSHLEHDNTINSRGKPIYASGRIGVLGLVGWFAEAGIDWVTGKPPQEWIKLGLSGITRSIGNYLSTDLYSSVSVNRFGLVTPYVQPCPPGEICPQDDEEYK